MSLTWQTTPEEAFGALADAYVRAIHQGVLQIAQRRAPEIEEWLKQNAVWTDRTGEARRTLFTDILDITNSAVVIVLGHGVEYGVYLELAMAGRYAVLGPALDTFIPLIWRDVQNMLRN